MATWPVDDKVISLEERIIKPANRKTSAAGYTMSSPRGTIFKKIFIVNLAYITKAEKDTIETFFDVNQGVSLTLNDPDPNSSETFEVIFNQDSLDFKYTNVFPGEYTLNIEFGEV